MGMTSWMPSETTLTADSKLKRVTCIGVLWLGGEFSKLCKAVRSSFFSLALFSFSHRCSGFWRPSVPSVPAWVFDFPVFTRPLLATDDDPVSLHRDVKYLGRSGWLPDDFSFWKHAHLTFVNRFVLLPFLLSQDCFSLPKLRKRHSGCCVVSCV